MIKAKIAKSRNKMVLTLFTSVVLVTPGSLVATKGMNSGFFETRDGWIRKWIIQLTEFLEKAQNSTMKNKVGQRKLDGFTDEMRA